MSTLHFKWGWGKRLAGHVSSLLRIRPRPSPLSPSRPLHNANEAGDDRTSPRPARNRPVARAKSLGASSRLSSRRDKGKRRADMTPIPGVVTGRSKSIERWPMSNQSNKRSRKIRRGSETHLAPPQPFQSGSTPHSSSTLVHGDDRLRSRITLSSIWRWRPRYSPHATSPVETRRPTSRNMYPRSGVQSTTLADSFSRRSADSLRHSGTAQTLTGTLTAARRASSWGENPTDFLEEVASLNSEEPDLDESAMILGAGGVCNDLCIVSPNMPGISAEPSGSSSNPWQPQPTRTFGYGSPPGFLRYPHSASPLAQVAYESESSPVDDDDDDDLDEMYSSSLEEFDEPIGSEESDEDEEVTPLEVRRRIASPPPPPREPCDEPS
jgi:hypothetical protein